MKTIGLVTLYNSNNYGAMLQAYALYKSIEKNGCICQIVQHDRFDSVPRKKPNKNNTKISKLPKSLSFGINHPISILRRKLVKVNSSLNKCNNLECAAFRNTFFKNLSPHFYPSYESIKNDPPVCDGLVCGSDQIWNPSRFTYAAPFFLDFGDKSIKRIAYAPSLATSAIPENMADQYNKWISAFDHVSVREKSGASAIAKVCNFEPECVLDPTFLLSNHEWNELAIGDKDRKKKFIFCYFLGRENFISASKHIIQLAKSINAEIVVLPAGRHVLPQKYCAQNIKVGPRSFLGYIRDAAYVITDSFHGTAFSIIFQKQFYVFKARDNTPAHEKFIRMEEILDSFNLNKRVFSSNQKILLDEIDYSKVKEIIESRIKKSTLYLSNSLKSVPDRIAKPYNSMRLATQDECTGCTACVAICPTNAISMKQNSAGFWYPHVDSSKCIQCGTCYRKCPVLHSIRSEVIPNRYAAIYSTDKEFRAAGSSGNAFGLIVNAFNDTNDRTVIYGAAFEPDYYSVSCKSTEEVELKQLQKSKYLESYMGEAISRIKKDINAGKKVLFCGTPCQVIGVRSVLGHHENLLLCDFICHGTPSATWFAKYLIEIEKKYGSKVNYVDFRPKLVGWAPHSILIKFRNGFEYKKTTFADPYMTDFARNTHLRNNCYNCNRIMDSQADLTIGDYWAARVYKNIENTNEGISVVRAQTQQGMEYLQKIMSAPNVFAKELSVNEIDRTFVYRKRKIPISSTIYPDRFPMHPKRDMKGWLRFIYYELYVKHIKYRV